MSSFKKFQLVSEEELNRLKQKQIAQYDPQLRAAAFLQSEIDDLLSNKQMDPEHKMQLFQMAQQRFTSLRGKHAMEETTLGGIHSQMDDDVVAPAMPAQQVAHLAQGHVTPGAAAQVLPAEANSLIDFLPRRSQEKAKKLLNELGRRGLQIKEDDGGQMMIADEPIIGSNYQDLMSSLYSARKNFHPPGQDTFLDALGKVNIPHTLIGNTQIHSQIPHRALTSSQSSTSLFTSSKPSFSKATSSKASSSKSTSKKAKVADIFSSPTASSPKSISLNPFSYNFPPPGNAPRLESVYKTA